MGEKGSARARIKRCTFPGNAAQEKEWGVVGLPHRAASRVSRRLLSEHPGNNAVPNPQNRQTRIPKPYRPGQPCLSNGKHRRQSCIQSCSLCSQTIQSHGVGGWEAPGALTDALGLSNCKPEGRTLRIVFLQQSLSLGVINRSPWERDLS